MDAVTTLQPFRMAIGDIEIVALDDGPLALPASLFADADPESVAAYQKANGDPVGDTVPASVNCFAVTTGDRLVLVDTGAGTLMAPVGGRLPAALDAAGIGPDDIDAILLTHLHRDHVGGLFAANGTAAFPDAELLVPDAEIAYWTDKAAEAAAPEARKSSFAINQAALKAYEGRVRAFGPDAVVAPGISAVPLPGHTPGHTGFLISSGDERLMIWGDIVHSVTLQFPQPDWSVAFDIDPVTAAATRRTIFERGAAEALPIASMHIPHPGIGRVEKAGDGYAFVPETR